MILGSFDADGRPYMQGRLFFPRLQLDAYIDFLVDTGADVTTLHPPDSITMGIQFGDLSAPNTFERTYQIYQRS